MNMCVSKFLIPIMIVPCDVFIKNIKLLCDSEKMQWIFIHLQHCKICDITNNNDRISINMLHKKYFIFKRLSDHSKIIKLLQMYHNLQNYKIAYLNKSLIILVEIINNVTKYNGCYCVVGKMNKKY